MSVKTQTRRTGRIDVERAMRLSDDAIAELAETMTRIDARRNGALSEYEAARQGSNDADEVARLEALYDRAAHRAALAREVFERAWSRQPKAFERVVGKKVK